ncbi:hypothetical protein GGR57DRAFT_495329 [Xylariaceae sp. FL1272]|nr:hypothetical protein GGR57DRAFT_495329 [Xylariaceae sp. FL1272]
MSHRPVSALEVVRFRGRYEKTSIIASIPVGRHEHIEWLEHMRAGYAAREAALEQYVYEIRDGSNPVFDYDHPSFAGLISTLPSELPRFPRYGHDFDSLFNGDHYYIINLDQEVLTIDYKEHWKLREILRDTQFDDFLCPHKKKFVPAPPEIIMSPALPLPQPVSELGYNYHRVRPNTWITDARKAFLTQVLAEVLVTFKKEILSFGMEWDPSSFPFRELSFALIPIASGVSGFHSFPARNATLETAMIDHLDLYQRFLDQMWAGNYAPLLEFGSMCHRAGDAAGVSPAETMYWLEEVLISLTMTHDGGIITKTVDWGLKQGRKNFQVLILSLFEATFVEVSLRHDDTPRLKVSEPVNLSPLSQRQCMSFHPLQQCTREDIMANATSHGNASMHSCSTGASQGLRSQFPGLAALVNFFDIADNRRAASKSRGIFPTELYDRISCTLVSTELRATCLRKFRIDDATRITRDPFVCRENRFPWFPDEDAPEDAQHVQEDLLAFEFEDMQSGEASLGMREHNDTAGVLEPRTRPLNWRPIVGSSRKAIMLDVIVQFKDVLDTPVEIDSDDSRDTDNEDTEGADSENTIVS